MHSWEIVCIDVDSDSEYDDCRAITELGYLAPTLNKKSSDEIGAQIHQGHRAFHITIDGTRHQLKSDRQQDVNFYVRTLDKNSVDDPLLSIEACSSYQLEDKMSEL